eukprot:SAG22_NODE_1238_length_5049_cov_42.930707_1_plen_96_part_00
MDSASAQAAAAAACVAAAAGVCLCVGAPSKKAELDARTAQAAQAAVVGNLVADAAAVTCHWVYDQSVLAKHVEEKLGGGEKLAVRVQAGPPGLPS